MNKTKIMHLLSGGLDSTVLLYEHISQGFEVNCVLFNYGQIHLRELTFARKHCISLKVPYTEVELQRIKNLFARSALTDGKGSVVVPNRNAVLLHIAATLAVSSKCTHVTYACNKDDQDDFPDCRWSFVEAMNATLKAAQIPVEVCAPYIGLTKYQIVQRAKKHGWPYLETLSCYKGTGCGRCPACKKRKEAIQ